MSTMSADDTDASREESADVDKWEQIGRKLLAEQLEVVALHDIQESFKHAVGNLKEGEELSEEDVEAMREALTEARRVVTVAAEASPETNPLPDMWKFLDEEAMRKYKKSVDESKSVSRASSK